MKCRFSISKRLYTDTDNEGEYSVEILKSLILSVVLLKIIPFRFFLGFSTERSTNTIISNKSVGFKVYYIIFTDTQL